MHTQKHNALFYQQNPCDWYSFIYVAFFYMWVRVFSPYLSLWQLWRRLWKSVISSWKSRRTVSPLLSTANMVSVFSFCQSFTNAQCWIFQISSDSKLEILQSRLCCSVTLGVFLQASWRHIICLFRTVKAYKRSLIKTAVAMFSGVIPGRYKIIQHFAWPNRQIFKM